MIVTVREMIDEIDDLHIRSNFNGACEEDMEWDGIRVDGDGYVFVPQGSTFGNTLITTGDVYEHGGYDAMFIQKLVQAWPYIYNALKDEK